MTDSMKFGPEWLRNMSADTAGISSSSAALNHASSNNVANHCTPETSAQSLTARNMFPEFRYGREEMLSLFDRNCSMPELLPIYKNIFIEKVQYPLALTPSTDEEVLLTSPAPPPQRLAWLQRSPVGFVNSTRGGCLGGRSLSSIDRGRTRGKSIYHSVYHRPTALYEDDLRGLNKSERGWSERNGGSTDPMTTNSNNLASSAADWNGTPTSSPRKEFANHHRNLENWRRNRNEEGQSEFSGSGGISGIEGWRTSGSVVFGSSQRWGRSTSWRDEENVLTNHQDGGYGAGVTIQRSYSTIGTNAERSGYICNSITKNNIHGFADHPYIGRGHHSTTGGGGPAPRNVQWVTNSSSGGNNNEGIGGHSNNSIEGDNDDNLPEWAMENASEGGGTFDSTGAFHGSSSNNKEKGAQLNTMALTKSKNVSKAIGSSSSSICSSSSSSSVNENNTKHWPEECSIKKETNFDDYTSYSKNESKKDIMELNPSSIKGTEMPLDELRDRTNNVSGKLKNNEVISNSPDSLNDNKKMDDNNVKKSLAPSGTVIASINASMAAAGNDQEITVNKKVDQNSQIPVSTDFSDRMKEVADDMVEKLIMDDDVSACVMNEIVNSDGLSPDFVSPVVVSIFNHKAPQQLLQQNHGPQTHDTSDVSMSPTHVLHKGVPLYGVEVVDHVAIQQHQIQQQQQEHQHLTIPASMPHMMNLVSGAGDMWFYRDPQSKVQGPFSALEMTEWYRAGYFNENLFVRRVCDMRFRALGELIKLCHGHMPFTNSNLIPPCPPTPTMGLENMHLSPPIPKSHMIGDTDEFKGNVTAAANAISSALKSLISSVDMPQMLDVHFQLLQEQYLNQQEIIIHSELSKNQCFQRLTMAERDAVVRQKVQMHGVPEYLTSLRGLTNSLAIVNPAAGNQLYTAIAECSKREQQVFSAVDNRGAVGGGTSSQPQSFLDPNDFLVSNVHPQRFMNLPLNSVLSVQRAGGDNIAVGGSNKAHHAVTEKIAVIDDDLRELDMCMLLQGGNLKNSPNIMAHQRALHNDFVGKSNNFTTEHQILSATGANMRKGPTSTASSPIMQMWMPQITSSNSMTDSKDHHQNIPLLSSSAENHNQWAVGPLMGIPSSVIGRNDDIMHSNVISTSMWDVVGALDQQSQQQHMPFFNYAEKYTDVHVVNASSLSLKDTQSPQECLKMNANMSPISLTKNDFKETQQPQQQQDLKSTKDDDNIQKTSQPPPEKKDQYASKRINKEPNQESIVTTLNVVRKRKDETAKRALDEDRRRDHGEEKRRQKDERKRQQHEEEKRRLQRIEDEKRRQVQEEKERQQQIQAQRRKALLGNANGVGAEGNSGTTVAVSKGNKEHIRASIQSSVAPWSSQSTASATKSGPCFADIQKAERRERRADQQRQMEILDKQMRANAAAVSEANDSILKWNAAPLPVKSFAEIQAEESKRLAIEHEQQRRKEQEQHTLLSGNGNPGHGSFSVNSSVGSNTITATIWGNGGNATTNKIWGGTAGSSSGFWEDTVQFKTIVTTNNSNSNFKSPNPQTMDSHKQGVITQTQQKSPARNHGKGGGANIKNIKKSQTVSVMQNSANNNSKTNNTSSGASLILWQSSNTKTGGWQKSEAQVVDSKLSKTTAASVKIPQINDGTAIATTSPLVTSNKCDTYESEFTSWCTKSLNNMNTKVDVPTFVTFLQDLESPYEVKDYIRMYLGEAKEYTDFAKQFLERRSKYKNLQRAQNAHNDDMCKPAPAITPSGNDGPDNKGKQRKVKKNKMTKLDARILGFSVTAAEGRINVGDRDYVDAP